MSRLVNVPDIITALKNTACNKRNSLEKVTLLQTCYKSASVFKTLVYPDYCLVKMSGLKLVNANERQMRTFHVKLLKKILKPLQWWKITLCVKSVYH